MTGSMAGAEAVTVYRSEDEVPEPDAVRPFPNEGGEVTLYADLSPTTESPVYPDNLAAVYTTPEPS